MPISSFIFFFFTQRKYLSGVFAYNLYVFLIWQPQHDNEKKRNFQHFSKNCAITSAENGNEAENGRDGQVQIFSLHSALYRQLNLHCQWGGKKRKKYDWSSPVFWYVPLRQKGQVRNYIPKKLVLSLISGFIAQQQTKLVELFCFLVGRLGFTSRTK